MISKESITRLTLELTSAGIYSAQKIYYVLSNTNKTGLLQSMDSFLGSTWTVLKLESVARRVPRETNTLKITKGRYAYTTTMIAIREGLSGRATAIWCVLTVPTTAILTALFLIIELNSCTIRAGTRANSANYTPTKSQVANFGSSALLLTPKPKLWFGSSISRTETQNSICTHIRPYGALTLKSKFFDDLSHDRANCMYAHNFQDYRRNPA